MYRIATDTAAASSTATAPTGSAGYWSEGNPSTGAPATVPGPYWFQMIDDEMIAVLTQAGITPTKNTHTQIRDSIIAIANAAISGGGGAGVITIPMNRMAPQWVSSSSVKIPSGFKCNNSTGQYNLSFGSDATVSINSAGIANGLDAGAKAANTFYYLHAIGHSSGTPSPAGLLSLSRTAPTLPTGYNIFRPLPVVWLTDASSNIKEMFCLGSFPHSPVWIYNANLEPFTDATNRILNGVNNIGLTLFDASPYVPPKATTAIIQVAQKNNFNQLAFSPNSTSGTGLMTAHYDETRYRTEIGLNSSQQGYQKGSTGGVMYASVQGYRITQEFDG